MTALINIKISGIDTLQKQLMIDLFKNFLLMKQIKISESNNSISIVIHDNCITLQSSDQSVKLNKPVSVDKLIKTAYNMSQNKYSDTLLKIQNIIIDTKKHTAICNKQNIDLTEKEIQIIICLYNSNNRKLSKNKLLVNVWGYSDNIDTHTLESHIYKLRQKIEKNPKKPKIIITDNGSYKLVM